MLYNGPTGGGANDPYVGKNVAAGTQGSKVPPAAVEYPQREIVNAIASSGQAPSNGDLFQLWKAMLAAAKSFLSGLFLSGGRAVTFTPAGTYSWTVPAGVTVIEVELWGAGGSGSGGVTGYGGGPGGYSKGAFAVTPGQVIPIVVGAGASGGTGDGATGGTTSVGTFNYAYGGGGGSTASTTAGAPGTAGGGSINFTASRGGGAPYALGSGVNGGGAGGAAPFGGAAGQVGLNSDGYPGLAPGGGANGASKTGGVGGRGADGFVIIRY